MGKETMDSSIAAYLPVGSGQEKIVPPTVASCGTTWLAAETWPSTDVVHEYRIVLEYSYYLRLYLTNQPSGRPHRITRSRTDQRAHHKAGGNTTLPRAADGVHREIARTPSPKHTCVAR